MFVFRKLLHENFFRTGFLPSRELTKMQLVTNFTGLQHIFAKTYSWMSIVNKNFWEFFWRQSLPFSFLSWNPSVPKFSNSAKNDEFFRVWKIFFSQFSFLKSSIGISEEIQGLQLAIRFYYRRYWLLRQMFDDSEIGRTFFYFDWSQISKYILSQKRFWKIGTNENKKITWQSWDHRISQNYYRPY